RGPRPVRSKGRPARTSLGPSPGGGAPGGAGLPVPHPKPARKRAKGAAMAPPGRLYVCGTPIGNLEDITLRALRVLREVSLIAAEDTRHTRKLLNHYGISTPVTSLHEHNEARRTPELVQRLLAGQSVALVSDAGMPGIQDPGVGLIRAARDAGVPVTVVPGPTAPLASLVGSGLPAGRFAFAGSPPLPSSRP